jgi:uncharacterized membrane protein YqiK
MLISGGKQKTEGAQFRVVIGHGAWILPGFRKVRFLGLELHKVDISESCRSTEGILLNLRAVAAFKVQSDVQSVNAAAQRFLGEQKKGQMEDMTNRIFAGHLRSIVGSMRLEDIHRNRDALALAIMEHSQNEMSRLGLTVDSLQIEHLDDNNIGYLDNLAKPHLAAALRDADMAQAKAAQEAAQAVQEAERKKNDQIRETQLRQAAIKAEVDKANAEANAAGQLAEADVERQVLERRQAVADTNAALRERELIAEQIKPAEAQARRVRIEADAQTGAAEAAAKRAEFEADAAATREVKQAQAAAAKVKLDAEALRDAATFKAEATRAEGEANAAARRAEGEAEAAAKQAYELAEAAGALKKAEALAANNNAQIEAKRVEVMPAIARELAQGLGLQHANLNILNGGAGLAEVVGALGPIYQMVTGMFAPKSHDGADNGASANGADFTQVLRDVEKADNAVKQDGAPNR